MSDAPYARRPGPGDRFAEEGAALVRERSSVRPAVALVLGSGLGDAVAGDLRVEEEFAFEALPGFPTPSIPGHEGRLRLGELYGRPAAVFAGRVHYYEGHGMAAATLIPRLADALGARTLILANAAGGLDPAMRPGELMLIRDHINWMGADPLFGWRMPGGGPAFVDTSRAYDPRLIGLAEAAAGRAGVSVRTGVYAAASGPSYETAAERVALARLGADAVGMSTVPEAVAAAALGLAVLGISCITNVVGTEVSHEEVLAAARAAVPALRQVLAGVLGAIQAEAS